jgi:hypothetical protein
LYGRGRLRKGPSSRIPNGFSGVAALTPDGPEVDPVEDHHQVGRLDLDVRGPLRRCPRGEEEVAFFEPLEVGITVPSFLVRYTIFARSGCCRHEPSASLAIGQRGSWE